MEAKDQRLVELWETRARNKRAEARRAVSDSCARQLNAEAFCFERCAADLRSVSR
jgi:hypothetical protein